MFNLPDLNVTGFESKAYIRYYVGCLVFFFAILLDFDAHLTAQNIFTDVGFGGFFPQSETMTKTFG